MLTEEQAEELGAITENCRTVAPSHLKNAKVVGQVTQDVYHAKTVPRGHKDYVMSRSDLMEFSSCPSRWVRGYKEDDTESMAWGSLVDCMLLTPERFETSFSVAPLKYPAIVKKEQVLKDWNRNATFCEEWELAENAKGKEVVKTSLLERAQEAVAQMRGDDEVKSLLDCSNTQVMATADYHDMSGIVVPVKILVDLAPRMLTEFENCLADLKTASSANARAWSKQVFQYKLQVQAALYLDVWNAATGENRNEFRHVIQESFAPWEIGKRILSAEFIEDGRSRYKGALARYAACLRDNRWPGYDDDTGDSFGADINLNGWTITNLEPWMISQ